MQIFDFINDLEYTYFFGSSFNFFFFFYLWCHYRKQLYGILSVFFVCDFKHIFWWEKWIDAQLQFWFEKEKKWRNSEAGKNLEQKNTRKNRIFLRLIFDNENFKKFFWWDLWMNFFFWNVFYVFMISGCIFFCQDFF